MNDMNAVHLEDVAHIRMGQSPPSSSYNEDSKGLPFLQGCADFTDKYPITSICCDSPTRIAPKGAILISVRAPVGTLNLADQKYCIGRGLGCIEGRTVKTNYLYYLLALLRPRLERRGQGSTFEAINSSDLRQLCIELPPLPEQRKIAAILTTVDGLIEKTEALIGKYQSVKQGLMGDLFTRGVDPKGRLRPPRTEAPQLYKQSELGWIPKEWEASVLDQAIRIIDCKHYTPKFVDEGFAFIRPRNVQLDGLDLTDLDCVSPEDFRLLTDKHEPRRGDIIFSRNASFGVPCFVDTDRRMAIGQDTVVMTETNANTKFVYFSLLSTSAESQVRRASTGSTFGRINLAFIRELVVPLPPRREQEEIAARLDSQNTRIELERLTARKLRLQKTGLMQDLLTGKVRVHVDGEARQDG